MQNFFLFLTFLIIGNLLSQKFSGKFEGDQSVTKSIIIPLKNNKILWIHHWAFYALFLILLIFTQFFSDLIYKILIILIGVLIMTFLLYKSNLITSLKHLGILILLSIFVFSSLFFDFMFYTDCGLFLGMILHGLSYKDRFEFVKENS